MTRLSGSVSYYIPKSIAADSSSLPPNPPPPSSKPDPELILLFSWMGAKDEHIAKYVEQHRVVFPTSRIIVARCPFSHVACPPLAWQHIQPIVPILRQFIDTSPPLSNLDLAKSSSSSKPQPQVLIHAFSNGGISTAMLLYAALKRSQNGTLLLPRYTLLFDSCPGTFRWRNTAAAMAQVLPRWTHGLARAVVFSIWLMYKLLPFMQPAQDRNTRQIRHPRYLEREVRRGYLYGSEDDKIPEADVEKQAALAREAGFDVRMERFEGAKHCAIPVTHAARYWAAVREIWDGDEAGVVVDVEANVEAVDLKA